MKRELLKTLENKNKDKRYVCEHTYPELTSLCPISKLPDYYTVKLFYEPMDYIIELKSLKIYFIQYRDAEIYHEELLNEILEDLKIVLEPKWIYLELTVNVRGGILTIVKRFWDKDNGDDIKKTINGNF